MSRRLGVATILLATAFSFACTDTRAAQNDTAKELIAKERAALARWGNGDPGGYIEIFAPEITYFNPFLERRIDGFDEMSAYYRSLTGEVRIDRFEIVDPTVQLHDGVAVLSYHLYNYRTLPDESEEEETRWNSTKVYAWTEGDWRIVHNHWAFLKPDMPEESP